MRYKLIRLILYKFKKLNWNYDNWYEWVLFFYMWLYLLTTKKTNINVINNYVTAWNYIVRTLLILI